MCEAYGTMMKNRLLARVDFSNALSAREPTCLHAMPWFGENDMNVMPIERIIEKVTEICKKNNIEHLKLFGSFATGTATEYSDIDFVVYGCPDILKLERDMEDVETLRKIDIFDYDSIRNKQLLEDIDLYGKQIY